MTDEERVETWERECDRARGIASEPHAWRDRGYVEDAAMRLAAVAHHLFGIACPGCSGMGRKTYADTTGWAGGVGGQAMTVGVCDVCWGTGRTDRTGIDRHRLSFLLAEVMLDSSGALSDEAKRTMIDRITAELNR